MAKPKTEVISDNRIMHCSVGAVIEQNGKYLLIDRAQEPLGFAGVAGHVDEGETPEEALQREVHEESGLDVVDCTLLIDEIRYDNACAKGVHIHHWYVFRCAISGQIQRNHRETKSIGWYSKEDVKQLKLEPVWGTWFRNLKII